jgi:hypothetical protein
MMPRYGRLHFRGVSLFLAGLGKVGKHPKQWLFCITESYPFLICMCARWHVHEDVCSLDAIPSDDELSIASFHA